jgi:hypothetical protein
LLITVLTLVIFTTLAAASDASISRFSQLPPEAQVSILASLTASNGQASDWMGNSVAIEGDTVVVGAPQQGVYADLPGAVYVFVKPASGWANMTQTATLTASDQNSNGHGNLLGNQVAISKGTIIAGAPWSGKPLLGAVYVYVRPAGGWRDATETGKLTSTDLLTDKSTFGGYVAIDGDTIVATQADWRHGAAYVFVKPARGWVTTTQTAKLTPSPVSASWFGISIGISNNAVVVGCPLQQRGTAYVFVKPTTGWQDATETAQLRPHDETTLDEFGQAVAISGDEILGGAPFAVVNGAQSGAAYVFLKPAAGWKTTQHFSAKLTPSDGTSHDAFGMSVAINGGTAVVGAPAHPNEGTGAVYVFSRPATGWTSTSQPAAVLGTGIIDFGLSVAVSGSTIVSGEPTAKIGNNNAQGTAFVLGQ